MNRLPIVPSFSKSPFGCSRERCDCFLGFIRTSDGSTTNKINSVAVEFSSSTESFAANHLPHPFHDRSGL